MLTWSDIFYYIKLFLRWWFVLVLAVSLAAGTAWYVVRQQADMYTSQTTLSVGTNFSVAAPDQAQVALSNVLADYYAALTKREAILGPVVEKLQLNFAWWLIRDRMLAVRVDRGANLLEVRITDTDPERAAAITNAIGASLIAFTPNSQENIEAQQVELNRQLQESQRNLQAVEARIADLQDRLSTLSSAIDIADIQNQLQVLQATREQYLSNYSNLVGLSNQTLVNSLTIFEPAVPSLYPLPKKTALSMAMAGAGGLILAILAILILDRLDERWRTANELQSRTGIKSLGEVPETSPTVMVPPAFAARREQAVSAAYANMVLAAHSRLPRSLLVSSAQPSLARSAFAIDLAAMYARTGHRVILVDTESGPNYLLEQLNNLEQQVEHNGWRQAHYSQAAHNEGAVGLLTHLKPTAMHNVLVLSGRDVGHERFSTLVPLAYWQEMVAHLHKVADVIIFDGPATLQGPEAGILMPLVDGALLVLDGRQDSRSTAIKARKHLGSDLSNQFLGAIVVGRTSGTMPKAQPEHKQLSSGGGLRFAISRRGITITMGDPNHPTQPPAEPTPNGPRLLAPPYDPATQPIEARVVGESYVSSSEALKWEDLLKIEQAARAESQTASHTEPPAPAVIITPPPTVVNSKQTYGAWYSAPPTSPEQMHTDRQRRPRIANSQRARSARNHRE